MKSFLSRRCGATLAPIKWVCTEHNTLRTPIAPNKGVRRLSPAPLLRAYSQSSARRRTFPREKERSHELGQILHCRTVAREQRREEETVRAPEEPFVGKPPLQQLPTAPSSSPLCLPTSAFPGAAEETARNLLRMFGVLFARAQHNCSRQRRGSVRELSLCFAESAAAVHKEPLSNAGCDPLAQNAPPPPFPPNPQKRRVHDRHTQRKREATGPRWAEAASHNSASHNSHHRALFSRFGH